MPINKESRVWSDQGVQPDPGEETYEGQARPIAEFDNWAMWAVTKDIDTIVDALGELESIDSVKKLTFDVESNRGSPGTEGHVYIEVDTGRIFADDGSSWNEVGVSKYQQLAEREHGMEDHDGTVASSNDLDTTQTELTDHKNDETNPHNVTEEQTGAADSLSTHESSTGGVHGVAGTDTVAGQSDVDSVQSNLSDHESDTTNPHNVSDDQTGAATALSNHESSTGGIHGIASDDSVAAQTDVDGVSSNLSDHEGASNPHSGSASDTDLSNHESSTGGVHGVDSTDTVAGQSDVDTVQSNLSDHESDTTNPHNVTESQTGAATSLDNHESSSSGVHGVSDTDTVAGQSDIDDHESSTGGVHGIDSTDTVAGQSDVDTVQSNLSDHESDTTNPHNVTESQTGAADSLSTHESSSSGVHGVDSGNVASTDDVSAIQSSSDVDHNQTSGGSSGTPHDHADPDDPVTQFGTGTTNDGEFLKNEAGSLVGAEPDLPGIIEVQDVQTLYDQYPPENLQEPQQFYVQDIDDYVLPFEG